MTAVNAAYLLIEKAHEYELKSANEAEIDELAQAHGASPGLMPTVWATVAVTLREVADALEEQAA